MHLSVELASMSTKCWVFVGEVTNRGLYGFGYWEAHTLAALDFLRPIAFLFKLEAIRRPCRTVLGIRIAWSASLALTNAREMHTM